MVVLSIKVHMNNYSLNSLNLFGESIQKDPNSFSFETKPKLFCCAYILTQKKQKKAVSKHKLVLLNSVDISVFCDEKT